MVCVVVVANVDVGCLSLWWLRWGLLHVVASLMAGVVGIAVGVVVGTYAACYAYGDMVASILVDVCYADIVVNIACIAANSDVASVCYHHNHQHQPNRHI